MKNLEDMTDRELIEYRNELSEKVSVYTTRQISLKTALNSGYGAFGNKYFRFFDVRVAEAITLSGQLVSKWLFRDLNEYINRILGSDGVDYIAAGDTDSCVFDTDIMINGAKQKIGEFFESCEATELEYRGENNYIAHLPKNKYFTLTYDNQTKSVCERPVNYAMAHKVKKKMFRITLPSGKSVEITKDHSIMIERDGILQSCTVEQIKKSDTIISI